MKVSPLGKKVALVVQTRSFGRQRSNFLETKLAFKEGQVKPSTPGRILDPRRALLASSLFRKRKEKERIEGGKGERESTREKEREKRGIFSKLRG